MKFTTRHNVVWLTFILTLLLYIDRVCISAAKTEITSSLSISDTQFGWVLSAFALGYALFQTPSGILIDRFGPRKVLPSIVLLWSVFTAITGWAWSFGSLLLTRFLFGMGEAGAFPGISKSILGWFPVEERGFVTGINFSGSRLGAAFTLPFMVYLISVFGWRYTFLILGLLGFIWAFWWYYWYRDQPEDHPQIGEEELIYIKENRQKVSSDNKEGIDLIKLLKRPFMINLMIQYFASNYIFFFCLTWLFPFMKEKYQISDLELSYWVMMPFIFGALGNYFSGWLVDYLYKRTDLNISRKTPAYIGFTLVVVGLISLLNANSIYVSIISISISIFGADMTLTPSWSYCLDVGKHHAGAISGTMNMAGNLGSFFTALFFPYMIKWSGDENLFFLIGIALALTAIISWSRLNADRQRHVEVDLIKVLV